MATYSDAELEVLMADPESDFVERRESAADLPFDSRPAIGIELEDLDMDFLCGHYLPAAVAAEVLDRNQRTIEQQLRSCDWCRHAGRPGVRSSRSGGTLKATCPMPTSSSFESTASRSPTRSGAGRSSPGGSTTSSVGSIPACSWTTTNWRSFGPGTEREGPSTVRSGRCSKGPATSPRRTWWNRRPASGSLPATCCCPVPRTSCPASGRTASTRDLAHSVCSRHCGAPCEWRRTRSRPTLFSWTSARTWAHSIEPLW